MSELLDCPFCGHKPVKQIRAGDERDAYALTVSYVCTGCGCSQRATGDTSKPGYADNSKVEVQALVAWNTRVNKG